MKYLFVWALLCLLSPMASEETTEDNSQVTVQVKKTCPNNDQYCLECTAKICVRCGASYWDPNTGTCKPPKVRIDNCTVDFLYRKPRIIRKFSFWLPDSDFSFNLASTVSPLNLWFYFFANSLRPRILQRNGMQVLQRRIPARFGRRVHCHRIPKMRQRDPKCGNLRLLSRWTESGKWQLSFGRYLWYWQLRSLPERWRREL